jgi:hypothetical protein
VPYGILKSVRTITQELKKRKKAWILAIESAFPVIVVILVGMASFGLGRLSAHTEAQNPVNITIATPAAEPAEMYPGGLIVASKTGKKYHFPWCSGAKTMKASNRIWFDSEEAARAAGYTPAGNCAGLK